MSGRKRIVKNAREATNMAIEFLSSQYAITSPVSAELVNDKWTVEIDTGFSQVKIIVIIIDSIEGQIISYKSKNDSVS